MKYLWCQLKTWKTLKSVVRDFFNLNQWKRNMNDLSKWLTLQLTFLIMKTTLVKILEYPSCWNIYFCTTLLHIKFRNFLVGLHKNIGEEGSFTVQCVLEKRRVWYQFQELLSNIEAHFKKISKKVHESCFNLLLKPFFY